MVNSKMETSGTSNKNPSYKESNKGSKERKGVSVLPTRLSY